MSVDCIAQANGSYQGSYKTRRRGGHEHGMFNDSAQKQRE